MNADTLALLEKLVVPLAVVILAAVLASLSSSMRASTDRRRDRYAGVVEALIALRELTFRIRRRTSDDPEVHTALVERGHDLQERLARDAAWVHGDSTTLGKILDEVRAELDAQLVPWLQDAWRQNPITKAEDMNLGGWGPGDCDRIIRRFRRACRWRFGIRRIAMPLWALLQRWESRRTDELSGEPDVQRSLEPSAEAPRAA